jgi:glucose-6-phosphate-specific signal transduction histidine kinase
MIDTMTSARERIGKRDIAIASVLSVLGLALMYLNVRDPASEEELGMVRWGGLIPIEFALPLFLLVTLPLLWRRAAPIAAVGASFAGLVLNEVLIGTDVLRCGVVWPTALFFAFTAGAQLDGRDSRIGLALAAGLTFVDFSVGFDPLTIAVATTVTVAMWGIARIARSRRRMANELRARTAELREARDERARMEIATDRARISRELDELLQRRLGELARMADEGARPSDEATATATLVDIERESRRTLEEMRQVVGVLREESSQAPTTPQPTLIHLEAMLVRAKGAGARLAVEGSPRVLPAAVELSAYRIVEQLLTAIEDAPDVEVRVRFADDALELAVSGPARRRAKASIERARERARLQCGTLEATVRGGRAEAVASLPMLSAA